MRQSVTYKEKSEGFANQTFRLLLVGRSRSGFSSPDSDTYYTLGLAVETITESSMDILEDCNGGQSEAEEGSIWPKQMSTLKILGIPK